MGQRYLRIEDKKLGPGLECNLDFATEKGLEPKVKKIFKIVILGDVVSKLVSPKCITAESLGGCRRAIFSNFFLEKRAI